MRPCAERAGSTGRQRRPQLKAFSQSSSVLLPDFPSALNSLASDHEQLLWKRRQPLYSRLQKYDRVSNIHFQTRCRCETSNTDVSRHWEQSLRQYTANQRPRRGSSQQLFHVRSSFPTSCDLADAMTERTPSSHTIAIARKLWQAQRLHILVF